MTAVAAHVSLTDAERRVLVEVVKWGRLGAWSAASRFDAPVVDALRRRGLVRGDARLWPTRDGRELVAAGL